jgi:hypothetical protein
MSSSHVLLVPVIAAVVLVGGLLSLAAWLTVGHRKLIRAQTLAVSAPIRRLRHHARSTDDAVCALITDLDRIPATKDLLPDSTLQAIYNAHDEYTQIMGDTWRELN